MVTESALRGYVLEEILARLLSRSGYRLLAEASQDADALRDGRHGLLVRGRGSDHQADALGELLIPTPFSLPIRLFVEAKFRGSPIGISDIRNALGVISDVNEHFASDAPRDFPLRRHHYRYALFSVSGFTEDAQKYALAHQISLIDLQGPAFADLRAITMQTAHDLLLLAEQSGLSQFPLGQTRRVLRLALGTGVAEDETRDVGFEASYARASQSPGEAMGEAGSVLPARPLAGIAANLSEKLDDVLILGFPQGPFILVLQADDTNAFNRFLSDSPAAEIDVDIRYAPSGEKPGEWAIIPHGNNHRLIARFGIPPLLDSWLLAADAVELERAALAKRTLFSTIVVFREGNRALQFRYRKVRRPERTSDDFRSDPVGLLRRELASPELSFRGRQERDGSVLLPEEPDLITASTTGYDDSPELTFKDEMQDADEPRWTNEGLTELLNRLGDEHPVQAKVIRAAAEQASGQLSRALVYELGEYEEDRTLRGFTRPVNRITSQLQREGLVAPGVAPALEAVYEHGVQATSFAVPPDVQDLISGPSVPVQLSGVLVQKNLRGPEQLLVQIPGDEYRNALRRIFHSLNAVDGLTIYWGRTGCSLRVALPRRGLLSVGWIFPPETPRWMGLTDLTLGWYDDGSGLEISESNRAALDDYLESLKDLEGKARPDSGVIRGRTFQEAAVVTHADKLAEAIRAVVARLRLA